MATVQVSKIGETRSLGRKSSDKKHLSSKISKRFIELFGSESPPYIEEPQPKDESRKRPSSRPKSPEQPVAKRSRVSDKEPAVQRTPEKDLLDEWLPICPPTPRFLIEDPDHPSPDWFNWYDTLPFADAAKERSAAMIDKIFEEMFHSPNKPGTGNIRSASPVPKTPEHRPRTPSPQCRQKTTKTVELPVVQKKPLRIKLVATRNFSVQTDLITEEYVFGEHSKKLFVSRAPGRPELRDSVTQTDDLPQRAYPRVPVAAAAPAYTPAPVPAPTPAPAPLPIQRLKAEPGKQRHRVAHRASGEILAARKLLTSVATKEQAKEPVKARAPSGHRSRPIKRLHDSLHRAYRQQSASRRMHSTFA